MRVPPTKDPISEIKKRSRDVGFAVAIGHMTAEWWVLHPEDQEHIHTVARELLEAHTNLDLTDLPLPGMSSVPPR